MNQLTNRLVNVWSRRDVRRDDLSRLLCLPEVFFVITNKEKGGREKGRVLTATVFDFETREKDGNRGRLFVGRTRVV